MKTRQPIWEIRINKNSNNTRYQLYKDGLHIDKYSVLGVNSYHACINDSNFSTFRLNKKGEKKESYQSYFDHIRVSINVGDNLFDDGVQTALQAVLSAPLVLNFSFAYQAFGIQFFSYQP